jgi:hypothetical protein
MNKTLMLVICDFLLLSMLALARFDPPEDAPEPTLTATASSATAEAELIGLLEETLQSEQASRQNLTDDLSQTRESLQDKARQLEEREAALKAKSAEAQALAQSKAEVEAEQRELLSKVENTQSKLAEATQERSLLNQSLTQLEQETNTTKARLTQTQDDLIARELALAEREAALKEAQAEKEALTAEREALNRQLEVAKAERVLLEQNLSAEQQAKVLLQQEKEAAFARADRLSENVSQLGQGVSQIGQGVSQLGQGVSTLQKASSDMQKEMDASRPRTMSEIFTRFQKNRATLNFRATEKGLFGNTQNRTYTSKSILIKDTEGSIYLATHTSNTPFAFNKNPQNILSASLTIELGNQRYEVPRIAFLNVDPRLIYIPIPKAIFEASGLESFELALQPERWEEAVLIKNDETNFGSAGFRRLTSTERFLRMDRPALGELFAEFASSSGDLAFTKNARFIGILSDTTHAVVLNDFLASGIINLGEDYSVTTATNDLTRLEDRIRKLPSEVQ